MHTTSSRLPTAATNTTTSTATTSRLASLISHLSAPPLASPTSTPSISTATSPHAATMAPPPKPKITCHVLDTTIGRPGAGIPASVTCVRAYTKAPGSDGVRTDMPALQGHSYTATTDADGRVLSWTQAAFGPTLDEVAVGKVDGATAVVEGAEGEVVTEWVLKLETGGYWERKGVEAFFGEVVVRFVVRRAEKEHFHVPVLLGPFSYTTYRGS